MADTASDAPGLRINVDIAQVDLERPEEGIEARRGEGAEDSRVGENLMISITAENSETCGGEGAEEKSEDEGADLKVVGE